MARLITITGRDTWVEYILSGRILAMVRSDGKADRLQGKDYSGLSDRMIVQRVVEEWIDLPNLCVIVEQIKDDRFIFAYNNETGECMGGFPLDAITVASYIRSGCPVVRGRDIGLPMLDKVFLQEKFAFILD